MANNLTSGTDTYKGTFECIVWITYEEMHIKAMAWQWFLRHQLPDKLKFKNNIIIYCALNIM